jgi:hypothetical protein
MKVVVINIHSILTGKEAGFKGWSIVSSLNNFFNGNVFLGMQHFLLNHETMIKHFENYI